MPSAARPPRRPTPAQRAWLERAREAKAGLPLFDRDGRRVSEKVVRACIQAGWAEPWWTPAPRRDWLVCRLTDQGRDTLDG